MARPEAVAAGFINSLFKPAHILVAISGGSDSTGLLVALAEGLKGLDKSDVRLSAATIDHGLRAEATEEAQQVAAFCAAQGIFHAIRRWDGDKPGSGIMAAAREARYGLLADIAAEIGANVLVTAHTLDDQHETLVMRASRGRVEGEQRIGTGIADAVLFDRRIWVLRPFLSCRRADIRAYLTRQGVSWIDDPSNEDIHYERVRTRKHLARDKAASRPQDGGPARTELSEMAAAWLDDNVAIHANALCVIRREGLAAEDDVLNYALSHLAAAFGGRAFGPGREQMGRILTFLSEGTPGRRTASGVVFDLRRGGLYIARESRGILPLTLPPAACGIWDGRFEVCNQGSSAVRVEPAGEGCRAAFPEGLPKAAVQRARAALPVLHPIPAGGLPSATITPYIAPFDRFLTRFDLTFAARLTASFARGPYLRLPL